MRRCSPTGTAQVGVDDAAHQGIRILLQVVEHGGFAPAGRALDMPKSKLSRRIALLEADVALPVVRDNRVSNSRKDWPPSIRGSSNR